ncbi:PAS domain S-box-containing protein/diguanylate cyclase (GGDEF)-like protein [Marinobacterium halophilum]|uniref:diguanylate cyclase n=1 Tax=Marinobacterium halophilum TaxID=267374 RepID=A0A2P8ERU8_9GAMM|nr:GGDEF domain-containing protein [Marinobacterium halophilum]PSL12200.1 PAS domain S-box-containing protein/diguanylate cyclase (GGDEF)-like protein [Marinobacterium halophilum]
MSLHVLYRPGSLFFWLVGLLALLLTVAIAGLNAYQQLQHEQRLQQQQRSYYLSRLHQELNATLDAVQLDVMRLATSPLLTRYLQQPQPADLELLQQSYLSLARLQPDYDQIRFINRAGQEVIRINRLASGDPYIVPAAALQNKADRYYIREGMRLGVGERYLSPLDLNVEQGEIEVPYKPMLRMVMPVDQPQREGLVVINYRGHDLLQQMGSALPSPLQPLLLNDAGQWLLGGGSRDWQFMFTPQTGLAVEMPAQWQQIQQQPRGAVAAGTDCYVYEWIRYGDGEMNAPRWLLGLNEPGRSCSALQTHYFQAGVKWTLYGSTIVIILLLVWYRTRLRQFHLYQRIRSNEQQLRLITDEVGSGLIMVDRHGCTQWMNPEAERLLGWTEAELHDQVLHPLIHVTLSGEDAHADDCPMLKALSSGERQQADREFFRTRDGRSLPVHTTVTPLPNGQYAGGAIIAFNDDSEHLAEETRLRRQAMTDELTGCLNRRAVLQVLDRLLLALDRQPGVVLIDIDFFKQVNDHYGHAAGDRVLAYYAQEVRDLLRANDSFGRIGGEEFLVVLETAHAEHLLQLAERIRSHFDAIRCPVDEHRLHVTASFGVAIHQPGESAHALLARADAALYLAKANGRNRVELAVAEEAVAAG